MSRVLSAALVALILFCATGRSSAQVTNYSGYPLRRMSFGATAGTQYEFQTTALSGVAPDTILTVHATNTSGAGAPLAGADGCLMGGVWQWERSCFRWTATSSATVYLHLWAYYGATSGTATVQWRVVRPDGTFSPWSTLGGGPLSFGGERVAWNPPSGTGRARFETTTGYDNDSAHFILVAGTSNWDVRYRGFGNSTRIGTFAEFDVANASTGGYAPGSWWVYFGSPAGLVGA